MIPFAHLKNCAGKCVFHFKPRDELVTNEKQNGENTLMVDKYDIAFTAHNFVLKVHFQLKYLNFEEQKLS